MKEDFPWWSRTKTLNFERRGLGLIPGQETRSHTLQLRVCMLQLKIPRDATNSQHSQIYKYFLKNNNDGGVKMAEE